MQERLWKLNVAKQLATEAARFDRRKQLKPADSEIGEEIRAAIVEALSVQVHIALYLSSQITYNSFAIIWHQPTQKRASLDTIVPQLGASTESAE